VAQSDYSFLDPSFLERGLQISTNTVKALRIINELPSELPSPTLLIKPATLPNHLMFKPWPTRRSATFGNSESWN